MGMEAYAEIARLVVEAREHYEQFLAGKKVAAVRARKCLQEVKKLAQICRSEIQDRKTPPEAPPPTGGSGAPPGPA